MTDLQTSPQLPSLSIIIPALNEEHYIGACIKALLPQLDPSDEIIVVDNGSIDNTASMAKSLGCVVVAEEKRGISYARNRGAKEAKSDILCFIDADGISCKSWVKQVRKTLKNPKISTVSGLNVFKNNSRIKETIYNSYTVIAYTYILLLELQSKSFLSSNNLAIRKEVFEALGGWEPVVGEDYWLSKEFWKRRHLQGKIDFKMKINYSSRRFDQNGYLRTIDKWLTDSLNRKSSDFYDQIAH